MHSDVFRFRESKEFRKVAAVPLCCDFSGWLAQRITLDRNIPSPP